jgi:4-amino-4-deoxy-L-arabinose transferase-like glycosyltransferase
VHLSLLFRNEQSGAARLAAGLHYRVSDVADPALRSGTRFRNGWSAVHPNEIAIAAIAILICMRFVLAARLPLSFDEAFYWLWSKHLALGYFEHPAAIAIAVRAGTLIFGDTELGVRFVPLLASVIASWAVWRSAAILLKSERIGATACVLFNSTLMIAAEGMGATPDSLLIAAAALLLWTMAKLQETQDPRWWLATGAAAGLAIASKYTGFFLCGSLVLWLLANSLGRSAAHPLTLSTPWPYIGAAVALSIFLPTLFWNATHGFVSFRFQFGRAAFGHEQLHFLLEFLGSQMALGSPFILVLAGIGLARNPLWAGLQKPLSFASAILWPPLAYFLFHAMHDRVQGNWPCFVYPALALLASQTFAAVSGGRIVSGMARLSRALALPVAGAILCVAYAQALFGIFPIGRRDPIARMMGIGFEQVATEISVRAASVRADAIITTNYAATSWLSFYERPHLPVIQITGDSRFLSSPHANAKLLHGRLLYVTQAPERELPAIHGHFSTVLFSGKIVRSRNGNAIDAFDLYALSGFRGPVLGRMP